MCETNSAARVWSCVPGMTHTSALRLTRRAVLGRSRARTLPPCVKWRRDSARRVGLLSGASLPGWSLRRAHSGPVFGGRNGRGLADLDQVPVGVADVAANLGSAVGRRRQELGTASAPLLVHRLDIGNPNVEKAANAVGISRGFERHRRLVVGWSTTHVDDDPAVGKRDERRLAGADSLAA